MSVKSEIRKSVIAKRKIIEHKAEKDKKISDNLKAFEVFEKSDTILFFAPTAEEINISSAVDYAFEAGKRVAFPRCIDKNGNMEFYVVKSFDELTEGMYGILEPQPAEAEILTDFTSALCVVPALSVDRRGYRVGYGKGYYDRFLQKNSLSSAALCYNEFISEFISNDEYDQRVDYIITESGAFKTI